jgi:flagellar biosynthesis GTPase FlhF
MSSLADLTDPTGFFSYSRQDDEHSKGALSRLRAQIYDELRLQLGKNFKLWQDTKAISEGTEWEEEIKRAISESVFFIPIVTPSSVASKHCHLEFRAFLDREEALGRKNLVFPLLYIRVPALEKDELWRQDPVLGIIGRRQYFDWQKFRHRAPDDAEVAQRIALFCENIVQSLQQPWIPLAERRAAEEDEAKRAAEQARLDEKERQWVEAEARQRAEEQRRAAEDVEAKRAAEQARLDEEERRRVEAEASQRAEHQRRVAEEADIAERTRLEQEEEKRQRRAKARMEREAYQARQRPIEEKKRQEELDYRREVWAREQRKQWLLGIARPTFVLLALAAIVYVIYVIYAL